MMTQSSLRDFSIQDNEALQVGEVFGGYQILCCLNYSILGGLYQVKTLESKEEYSLAVLPSRCAQDASFRQRFDQEVLKLMSLEHTNILRLLRWEELSGRLCLVYEAFDSENLNDLIEKRILKNLGEEAPAPDGAPEPNAEAAAAAAKPKLQLKSGSGKKDEAPKEKAPTGPLFEEEEAKKIVAQLLEGLGASHKKKLCHWGLTPTQVLMSSQGVLKIVGLGLHGVLGKDLFESLVSQAVIPVKTGKKRFLISEMDVFSPQREKNQALDSREDFFALGVLLYSVLTGGRIQKNQAYAPVSTVFPKLSKGWDLFLQKCLSKELEDRYQSAEAALSALGQLDALAERQQQQQEQQATSSVPPPEAALVKPKASSKGLWVALALGGIACLAVGLIFAVAVMGLGAKKPAAGQGVIVALKDQTPNVQLKVPEGSTVAFSGTAQPFVPEAGVVNLLVDPGTYSVTVSAEGFKPKQISLLVAGDPIRQTIVLENDYGVLDLNTESLTSVTVLDEEQKPVFEGVTDASGHVEVKGLLWKNRPYKLLLKKSNYQPKEVVALTIPDSGVLKESYKLDLLPGALSITSQPLGAQISLDGKAVGVTPLELKDLVAKKEMKLEATLEGYYPLEKTVILSPAEALKFDMGQLKGKVGSVELKLYWDEGPLPRESLSGLTLQIDEDPPKPLGSLLFENLIEGKHSVIARHPDCKTVGVRFMISENTTSHAVLKLVPYPSLLKVVTTPQAPVELFLEGRLQKPDGAGVFSIKSSDACKLKVKSPGYHAVEAVLSLKPKEEREWKIELKPIDPPELGKPYVAPDYNLELAWIPAGSFTMGSPRTEPQRLPEEGPPTPVTLTYGFWMGIYEITQAQYKEIMGDNPSALKGDKRPVESITQAEATLFCKKLTEIEAKMGRLPKNYIYRLPTEAEWEYAARAGSTEAFSFGSSAALNQGNFRGSYPDSERENPSKAQVQTTDVGSFSKNAFGLHDMHGNVSEWGLEAYRARLPGKAVSDPVGPMEGREYVIRGGNFREWADRARSAARRGVFPSARFAEIGMRVVLAPVPVKNL